jgi:hypothetical protein
MRISSITRSRWAQTLAHFAWNGMFVLFVLAGCASPSGVVQLGVISSPRSQEKDESKIEEAVYSYLLEKDCWNSGEYTAVFLKARDTEVAALVRKFPNHVPTLKTSDRVRMYEASSPMDKETGRPAIVLAAIASEPEGDHAQALGTYFAGPMVSGKYVFQLTKMNGTWAIESVR